MTTRPRFPRRMPAGVDIEVAHAGARMLGLPLLPQGEQVATLLEARNRRRPDEALHTTALVQMPRRSTKTTSIFETLLGRCETRPGHRVVITAQSGNIASAILREHAMLLLARGRAVESRRRHRKPGRIVYYANGGRERLEWPATDAEGRPVDVSSDDFDDLDEDELDGVRLGSQMWVVPPDPGAVRSRASDDIWVDEAGELRGNKGHDLLVGVLPLMDTRGPLAQLIISGTPGPLREGMFWDLIVEARAGGRFAPGLLDYSAPDDKPVDLESYVRDPRLWRKVHPGVASGLTTRKVLEERLYRLGPEKFAREYLCMWPLNAGSAAIDVDAWKGGALPEHVQLALPDRFGLAFDVAPDGSTAALAAAWRDEAGVARVGIVEYRSGTAWLAPVAHAVARKYRMPLRYDGIGANHGPAGEVGRLRGVTLKAGQLKDSAAAAQLLVSELAGGTLEHFDQPTLNAAVEGAGWRQLEGARVFGRRISSADVSPVVAASLALYQYDQLPVRQATRTTTSTRRAA